MTTPELIARAGAHTALAKDDALRILNLEHQHARITRRELIQWRQNLQIALSAVAEIERRAKESEA